LGELGVIGVIGVIGVQGSVGDEAAERLWILGEAAKSFGDDGKLAHWVRDRLDEERSDEESENDELLECLELAREKVEDDGLLKSDRAGDVVTEPDSEELRLGDCWEEIPGSWTSFRTTMRERWSRFLARRVETYSSAEVRGTGSCLESRSENPASSGDEMQSLVIGILVEVEVACGTNSCKAQWRNRFLLAWKNFFATSTMRYTNAIDAPCRRYSE